MGILKGILTFIVAGVVVYFLAEVLHSFLYKCARHKRLTRKERRAIEEQLEDPPLKPKRERLSFSQGMLLFQTLISLALIITCIVLKAKYMMDVSDLTTVLQYSFGLDGAWGGFYLWKSKNENRAKYAQQLVLLFADKYGPDFAVQIANIVLKD